MQAESISAPKIDCIYITHYTKLVDRKEHMLKQLSEQGMDKLYKIIWVDWLDREIITDEIIAANFRYEPRVLRRLCTKAEICNAIAHNYIITQTAQKYEVVMVIEDDMVLKPNFLQNLTKVFELVPEGWEIITPGGDFWDAEGYYREDQKDVNVASIRVEKPRINCTPTGCYILTKTAAKKISQYPLFRPFSLPIDETLYRAASHLNIFWCLPWICYEGSKTGLFKPVAGRGF